MTLNRTLSRPRPLTTPTKLRIYMQGLWRGLFEGPFDLYSLCKHPLITISHLCLAYCMHIQGSALQH